MTDGQDVGDPAGLTPPRRRIQIASPKLIGNERKYVDDCLDTGWISSVGSYVERFETAFTKVAGTTYAASCSNGTVAIHLALLALNIGPGDEVIVPTLTYVASANAVVYCGATPVFVDSEADTMNLDPAAVERAITDRTKAVVAVHLYGHPADMHALQAICAPRGIRIVEDAAEAHGASINGARVGSLGDIATFSFFGDKILTTGEGGMVTTNDPELDRIVRLFKGQGQDPQRRYWFPVVGYNYRMTNIAAAIGLAQVESIDTHLADRRRVAAWYDQHLVSLTDRLQLPIDRPGCDNVRWLYTVVLREGVPTSRDKLLQLLADDGIETRPVFYPMHHMPPYRDADASMPIADRLSANGLNLPTHGYLTEADVVYICERLANHVV
ncbi:MAG TPA: DegT/DnrJ/EryC1/StrS family aminotransferase [Ilumatobacteraceae bacterium]